MSFRLLVFSCAGVLISGGLELLFSYAGVLNAGGLELPSCFSKCSLSDPKRNQCIIEKGNAAIPTLVQGESTFGIPTLSPLHIPRVLWEGENLSMEWFNVYTDAINNYRLTDVCTHFEPEPTEGYYEGYMKVAAAIGGNYSIISGKVVDIPAYGSGNFMATFVGVTFRVYIKTSTYKKNGETYLKMVQTGVHTNITRAYYHFENIRSPRVDDVNAYIEKNWKKFTKQLQHSFGVYFSSYPNHISELVCQLPLSKVFIP